ncbi:efflux RND transporter permease subunit [Leeuwenhoekiella sp.]|uniref:efflux RND transporter permease subunit n=1 Tax=Leeuwenhoekiella sp. TaxID=1977054 RepID=UPI003242163A
MNIKTFVNRPVLATVISIVISILGILGVTELPITQYPQIAPPSVVVSTEFPGASAKTLQESVLIPLEEEINGVEDLDYITSSASNNGSVEITCFFKQGADPDIATVNVQNRITRARPLLPEEVRNVGITVIKQQSSPLMRVTYYTENEEEYDAVYTQNYMNINVITPMLRIDGVSQVVVYGSKDYAMRIWLKPDQLAAYNLVPQDIIDALDEQSLESAPGTLGQNSAQAMEYVIQYKGRYKTAEEYGNIIIKNLGVNQFLRLKDVADVELDSFSYSSLSSNNGYPAINTSVYQLPGSNAQETIEQVQTLLEEKSKDFPNGLEYSILYNVNDFLSASITSLIKTLIETFILVFLVVYIFLQDLRATIIPAIAVPVSIIGTFFFLNVFGYSINLLTLFALILAIGIVVDDAIVVVEAVKTKIDDGQTNIKRAVLDAMSEIKSAIISTTLVMAAVFLPVTFLGGSIGIFYEQFGVTLTIAIVISSINALTLSPALCGILLKPKKEDSEEKKNLLQRFFSKFNDGFDKTNNKYGKSVSWLEHKRWLVGLSLVVCIGGAFLISNSLSGGFVPTEDKNIIYFDITLPTGASLDRTYQVTEDYYKNAKDIKGIRAISLVSGRSFFSGLGPSYGLGFAALDDISERTDDETSIESILAQLKEAAKPIKDAKIVFFQPAQIPGLGRSNGYTIELLNTGNAKLDELSETASNFVKSINSSGVTSNAKSSLNTNFPQYDLKVDVDKIKAANLDVSTVLKAMQGYVGGIYAANFSNFNKQFRVYVQSLPNYRKGKDDLNQIYVRNQDGNMSPITQFVSLEKITGPQTISRFNLYNNATINGNPDSGFSSGDALKTIQAEAERLGANFEIDYSGITREEVKASGQLIIVFSLSLIMVYFFLAAQFESYIMPLAIILSLPIGIAGSFLFTWIFGLDSNIYFQISLIMLIGLLSKNAILIVEFGLQRRREGMSIVESAIDAAKARLRPILMTSLAFVVGMIPLIISSGVGANGNHSIGTGAAGGLLFGTLVGVFIIPILYIIFEVLHEKVAGPLKDLDEEP